MQIGACAQQPYASARAPLASFPLIEELVKGYKCSMGTVSNLVLLLVSSGVGLFASLVQLYVSNL